MKRLCSFPNKVIAGVLLVTLLFCIANYYLNFGLLGRLGGGALGFVLILTVVYIGFLGPTRQELEERKRRKSGPP